MQHKEEYDAHFKILLLGKSHVGKTLLLEKFIGKTTDELFETMGVDQEIASLHFLNKRIKLRIWDAWGNPKLKSIVTRYLSDIDGAFVCFDLTDDRALEGVKTYIEKIKEIKANIPIFLIGCKSDLSKLGSNGADQIKQLAETLALPYFETSSRKGLNVKEPFMQIMEKMYFIDVINKTKFVLQEYFANYTKSLSQLSNLSSLFHNANTQDKLLVDEYKANFDRLDLASNATDLEDFFTKTLNIIERSDLLLSNQNPFLNILASSPLSKVLKQILQEFSKMTKDFTDLSQLADFKKLQI